MKEQQASQPWSHDMHPLYVVFWIFFAAILARVGWSFVEMFLGRNGDEQSGGKVDRAGVHEAAGSVTDTDAANWLNAHDGGSVEMTGADSAGGWESGGDTGGDFGSDGGSESGGGGGGGW